MDMNKMMKQARKMQAEMQKAQEELANTEYSATAGGGMVEATVLGNLHVQSIKIDPEAVDPEDVEMLEAMIMAAINEAMNAAESASATRMNSITGGLGIPGM